MKRPYKLLKTFAALRKANQETQRFFFSLDAWSDFEWAAAAAGEAGELLNMLKKVSRAAIMGTPHTVTDLDLRREIADVIIYLDKLCMKRGWALEDCLSEKIHVINQRARESK